MLLIATVSWCFKLSTAWRPAKQQLSLKISGVCRRSLQVKLWKDERLPASAFDLRVLKLA